MEKTIEGIKQTLNNFLLLLTSIMLVTMTALVLWQVFTRYILGNPSIFTEELVTVTLIWTGFLGAAYVYGTRQDMALVFFKERWTGTKLRVLCLVIDITILIFAVSVMVFGGYKIAMSTMKVLLPVLKIPKGYVYMIGPITGIIFTIHQLINIWEDIYLKDESKLKNYESIE